jgi:transposase
MLSDPLIMSKNKNLTKDVRKKIFQAYSSGLRSVMIAKFFGCSKSTVDRIIRDFNLDGTIGTKHSGGNRQKNLTTEHYYAITRYIDEDCSISLSAIKARLFAEFGLSCSVATIHRQI